MRKRILSFLMTFIMIISLFPVSAFAATGASDLSVTIDTGASVTLKDTDSDGYYEIGTADELYAFAALVNGGETSINGKLTADITVNSNVLNDDGTLNGDGSGFCVWIPIGGIVYHYSGTFDGNGKTISGLYFNDSATTDVGLFGYVYRGTVKNVTVSDSYIRGETTVGGIAGTCCDGTVSGCTNSGTVIGESYYVGGIAGNGLYGTVTNCTNSGDVSGESEVGGIVGVCSDGTVSGCTNSGTVSGESYVGGIAGKCYYGTVSGCTNSGTVSGETNVGGIAGSGETVSDCTNDGTVIGESYVGGIAGTCSDGTVSGCTNSGTVSGEQDVGGIAGTCYDGAVSGCTNSGDVSGTGYVGGIAGYGSSGTVSGCTNDGTVSGESYVGGIAGDGYDGTVTNCTNSGDVSGESAVGGIVGVCSDGTVTNCTNSGDVSGESAVGGIAGDGYDGTVTNCTNSGDVSGESEVGGIAGDGYDGTVSGCTNSGTVSGNYYVGGIAGNGYDGTVTNCTNSGTVSGESYNVGGIAGNGSSGTTVSGCTNSGDVSGNYSVGGIAGYDYGTVTNCYYLSDSETDSLDGTTFKTAAQFASGEVAYLLQGDQTEHIWGQTIGTDDYPVLGGDKVYSGYTSCGDIEAVYSNSELTAEKPNHVDANTDHACDNGCGQVIGTCEDKDTDHACDYGCDKAYGEHVDDDKDHACDYGCKEAMGTCEDKDFDHKCDYCCDKAYGEHVDNDKDHACDYGCREVIGGCEDKDFDHDCDYGCGKVHGDHADSDKNHACDYGCKEAIGVCEDKDTDHSCDYGCDKTFGEHKVADKSHYCGYCNEKMTECADGSDADHKCDTCGTDGITEHKYSAKVTAPTCTAEGVKTFSCSACGHSYTEAVAKIGHTEAVVPAVAPSCTKEGLTEGKICSVCNAVIVAQKPVPVVAHSYNNGEITTAPSCTAEGVKTFSCTACGHTYTEAVAKTAHALTAVPAVDATYTAAGTKAYYICSACDKLFSDELGANAVTMADLVIPQKVEVTAGKAEVKEEVIEEAISNSTETTVTLPLTETKEETTAAQLPVASLEKIAEAEKELAVETNYATVTMDTAALQTITEAAGEESDVELKVVPMQTTELNTKQQAAVAEKNVAAVISAEILCNGENLHDFEGGKVTVKVPFTMESGTSASDYVLIYVDDMGNMEVIDAVLEGGYLIAVLDHFSEYVVINTKGETTPPVVPTPTPPVDPTPTPPAPMENPFVDVAEKDYFYEPVLWAVQEGITGGIDATHFAPSNPCTRGQVVTFLWRANGSPEPKSTQHPFTDISADKYYYKAVLWAVENGITAGMTATTFAPNNACTRGQIATFLWRANGSPEPQSSNNPFSDVNAGPFYKAILWAVEQGITTGYTDGTFRPGNVCTRGNIVTFLYRAEN